MDHFVQSNQRTMQTEQLVFAVAYNEYNHVRKWVQLASTL